jgi:hypothetical protein
VVATSVNTTAQGRGMRATSVKTMAQGPGMVEIVKVHGFDCVNQIFPQRSMLIQAVLKRDVMCALSARSFW